MHAYASGCKCIARHLKETVLWGTIDGLRACLHGCAGPQVGDETRLGGVTCLSIQSLILIWSRLHDKWGDHMRHFMDSRGTPPKRVTSSTWSHPPPCKQALRPSMVRYPRELFRKTKHTSQKGPYEIRELNRSCWRSLSPLFLWFGSLLPICYK